MNYINFDHYENLINSIVIKSREVFRLVKSYVNNECTLNDGQLRHDCSNYEIIYRSKEYQELNEVYGDTLYDLLKSEVTRRINNEVLKQCKIIYRTHVNLSSTEVTKLQDLVGSVQDELTRTQDRLVNAERQIDILHNENTRINVRLGRTEDEVYSLSTTLDTVQTELSKTQVTLNKAMTVVGGLQDVVEKQQTQIANQQTQIANQQTQIANQQTQIAELVVIVKKQGEKIAELEARLDSFFNFTIDDIEKAFQDYEHARDLKNRMTYSVTHSLSEITSEMSDALIDAEVQSVLLESVIKTQGFTENRLLETVLNLEANHNHDVSEDIVMVDHLIASCERIRTRLLGIRQPQTV